jgi:predicted lipoprotein with Yx(FWY)xxD motif
MTRGRFLAFFAGAAVLPLTAVTIAACGSGGGASASTAPPKTANGRTATVGVGNSDIGKVLVDSRGRTLYLFLKDSGTQSACTRACARAWPPLRANGKPKVGSGANASVVATSPRSDGKPQVIYNSHPLYRYQGDQKPGDTNGQGITAFGGGWFALSATGNQVSGRPSGPGSGGNGY